MAVESGASLWISFLSLALSGVALGWNIFRDVVDRGSLRVHCYIGRIGRKGEGVLVDNILVWNATNVGRQPIIVGQIGGHREEKPQEFMLVAHSGDPIPKTLQPGEYFSAFTEDVRLFGPNLRKLWVQDTLGRKYFASGKQVQAVILRLNELRAAGTIPAALPHKSPER